MSEIDFLIEEHKNEYQYFEVWLDYIDGLNEDWIDRKVHELGDRLILLFRRQNLESVQMSEEKRQSVMKKLDGLTCYLDLDIISQKNDLNFMKKNRLRIPTIISYHNYKKTPDDDELAHIVAAILAVKPTIAKIAAYCNSPRDSLRIMNLLLDMQSTHQRSIVLGMGPMGIITRVFGTFWGNEMIFAPQIASAQSAPGQLTKKQLEDIFTILNH